MSKCANEVRREILINFKKLRKEKIFKINGNFDLAEEIYISIKIEIWKKEMNSVHVLHFSEGAVPCPFLKSQNCTLPSFKSQKYTLPFLRN